MEKINWFELVCRLVEENLEIAKQEKADLKRRLKEYTNTGEKKICFFGCGIQGQVIYHFLKKEGIYPHYFLDNNSSLHGTEIVNGVKCTSLEELKDQKTIILLTVGLGHANEIYNQLTGEGFTDIIKFPLCNLNIGTEDIFDLTEEEICHNMKILYEILEDDISRKIAYIKIFVMLASVEELNNFYFNDIYSEPQYYPEDIVCLTKNEVIVEGGRTSAIVCNILLSICGTKRLILKNIFVMN